MKKRMLEYAALLLALLAPALLYPQSEYIGRTEIRNLRWGGVEHGWHHVDSYSDAVAARGPMGRLDVVLEDNAPVENAATDLLLHFDGCERDRIGFLSERYRAGRVDIYPSRDRKMFGACAAGFQHGSHVLEIQPLAGSLFFDEGRLGSFTIDFFLYPTLIPDGSSVFSWHAPVVSLDGGYTGVRAYFSGGRLQWLFENVFRKSGGGYKSIELGENVPTPLNEWHHHALSYDADTGLIAAYLDGRETNLVWATESADSRGTLLKGRVSPYLEAPMTLGDDLHGFIDEFRISRGAPPFFIGRYRNRGSVRSNVLDLGGPGGSIATVVKVSWESEEENGTAVRMYVRVSDTYFPPGAERPRAPGAPEWLQVRNGRPVGEDFPPARYLQWRAELFGTSDDNPFSRGTGAVFTPVLKTLTVAIEPDDPPLAPVLREVVPLDGGVRLSWVGNKESDIRGYRVYYGPASKFYFGRGSALGDSPVSVGNETGVVLEGLANEEVYFFAVTAVDEAGQESGFSRELVARPSRVFGGE